MLAEARLPTPTMTWGRFCCSWLGSCAFKVVVKLCEVLVQRDQARDLVEVYFVDQPIGKPAVVTIRPDMGEHCHLAAAASTRTNDAPHISCSTYYKLDRRSSVSTTA